MFKGYLPTGGRDGKTPTEEYKDRIEFYNLEDVENLNSYGGVLEDELIQIDIDNRDEAEVVLNIVNELNLRTTILETTRGLHFYFKNVGIDKRKQGNTTPIGVSIDVGLGIQNAVVPLKIKGSDRKFIKESDELDELPKWLYPIGKKRLDFDKLGDGDGRNSTLFTYILTLQQEGFTKDEIREIIRIINKFILQDPLQEREIETILRDEAFLKESFYIKGKLQYEKLADFLIAEHNIIKINDELHIYKDGAYIEDTLAMERLMLKYIVNSTRTPRQEVMRYIELKTHNKELERPTLIALGNGLLDIKNMSMMEFNPSLIIKNKINVEYNPNAYNAVMDKTLNKICCNDKQLRLLIEEMIGYTLFRRNELGKAFILTGGGSNGKSTLLEVLKKLLGKDNIASVSLTELSDRFKPYQLEGKLANIGDDISNTYIEDNSTFKKLVTGETVNVERKGRDPYDFSNYSKLIFSANEIPRINDYSDGLKRRLIFIPFNARFSKNDSDYNPFIIDDLTTKDALEHLLLLGIEGLQRILYGKEFTTSKKSLAVWDEYEARNNPIIEFMKEAQIDEETQKDVYMQYQEFCLNNGLKHVSMTVMSKEICNKGYDKKQIRVNGKRPYIFEKIE